MQQEADRLVEVLDTVILGKRQEIRLALACMLARGHLLLEDYPGMGKTTLSQAMARVFGLSHHRVQFTSDLLPADVTGSMVYEQQRGEFRFHPGPVFCQVLLADELNRATPRAQSALLQAMEENTVSIDSENHALPEPFFVIATQNPGHQSGTYPLPESQLDRFLMRLSLGYPDPRAERRLLLGESGRSALESLTPEFDAVRLMSWQARVPQVHLSASLLDYVQRLVAESRNPELCDLGLSPRGAMYLVRVSQAWALMQGRDHVRPDDLQTVFSPVCSHRIVGNQCSGDVATQRLLDQVNVTQ